MREIMAKQKATSLEFNDAPPPGTALAAAPVGGVPDAAPPAAPPPAPEVIRWSVTLNCPTPLTHRTLEVEGHNQDEAKAEFCRRNGISGSRHEFTILRLL